MLIPLILAGAPARSQSPANEEIRTPLLRYKLKLAAGNQPSLQITPEAVIFSLRGMVLKRMPVETLRSLNSGPLGLSSVESWTPPLEEVLLVARDNEAVSALELLESAVRLENMPETFTVELADGTLLLITSEESDLKTFECLRQRVQPGGFTEEAQQTQALLLQMNADAARQFYWLLQKGMDVIY